jgi:hypothetical protein
MTTTAPPASTSAQIEAVLRVFREAKTPLSIAQAKRGYSGEKIKAKDWPGIVEELSLNGRLFECFPAGRTKRYWVLDEKQRIRDEIERALTDRALKQADLINSAFTVLKEISKRTYVEQCIVAMREEGLLHAHPGQKKGQVLFAMQPFDALAAVQFKKTTLDDLTAILGRLGPYGLSIDQCLDVLRAQLQPQAGTGPAASQPKATSSATANGTPKNAGRRSASSAAPDTPTSTQELEELILKGMHDLEPNVNRGAPVLLSDLRRHMPREYQQHETFDQAVLDLAEREVVILHCHDQPSFLSDAEREELVRDDAGTYYAVIAQRV